MSKSALTQRKLCGLLEYDKMTGALTWKVSPNGRAKAGSLAGHSGGADGHRYVGVCGESHTVQRVIWCMITGQWPSGRVTFKNKNPLDYRWDNLSLMPTGGRADNRARYCREHRKAHPLHYRDKDLRRTFGIGLEQYQEMFVAQGGVCAICEKPEIATRNGKGLWLCVDHDHATGDVRGLLCSNCNRGIGCFGDDRNRLRGAIAYLDKHRAKLSGQNVLLFKKETAA